MGTVRRIAPAAGDVTLGQAVDAYLATLLGAEHASTRRTYGRILRRVAAEFGAETLLDELGAGRFAEWFGSQWADRSPSTWNVSLDAVRSAVTYWQRQGWLAADFSRMLVRRRPRPDRARALSRSEVDQLLTRKDISLRERTFWRMLYETAARSAEVLGLDVEDLDLPNRCARVRRKGGAINIIVWQTGTARLLPRLLKGRKTGPVFVTERKARVQLPAADLDEHGRARLSYQQAEALFTKASGGATLHHLRHSALTHDAEDGTGTPMLMRRSGHASVRSLARYARVSAEALMRHQAERDPARRR
jgi:integrase